MFGFKKKPVDNTLTKKEKFKKEAKSIFWIVFLVLGFRSMFFEPFKIPSGSMIPTLLIGDFILVNKMSYGVKVPFSELSVTGRVVNAYNALKMADRMVNGK